MYSVSERPESRGDHPFVFGVWLRSVVLLTCASLITSSCVLGTWQFPAEQRSPSVTPAAPRDCPIPAPTDAAAVAELFSTADPRVFVGGDGILSAQLAPDRVLVITADNFIDTSAGLAAPTIGPGTAMRHNAAFLTEAGCLWSAGAGELLATEYSHSGRAPLFFWPTALFRNHTSDFTLFADVMTTSSAVSLNSFDFHRLGVARYTVRVTGKTVTAVRESDLPADAAGITWSAGGGRDFAGRAVIYGSAPNGATWDIFAARTFDPLSDPATWEYATEDGWQVSGAPAIVATNCSDAVGALPADPYQFATKIGGAIGTDVALLRLSPATGRLDDATVVAHAPSTAEVWTYNPQFFPISDQRAALLINHNSTTPDQHDRSAFSPSAVADISSS